MVFGLSVATSRKPLTLVPAGPARSLRLGTKRDPLAGWRIRGIRQMEPNPVGERVYKLSRQRLESGTTDAVTLAQVREAGVVRGETPAGARASGLLRDARLRPPL